MTELYQEAAELLGLKTQGFGFVNPSGVYYRFREEVVPPYLAHLICEKEGWLHIPHVNEISPGDLIVRGLTSEVFPTQESVIRAFVEKYGKKKDELPELQDFTKGVFYLRDPSKNEMEIAKRIDTIEKLILKSLKSLSERIDKMEDSKNKSDNSKKLCYEGINIKEVLDIHGETVRVANSDTVDKAVYPLYDAIKDINNRIDKWERVNGS